MSRITKAGFSLLLLANGCASTLKYPNYPEDSCSLAFEVVEVGKLEIEKLPYKFLNESTLNGNVRGAVLKHSNRRIQFIVDPEFPRNEFDRWANNNLVSRLNSVKAGGEFPLECGDYRRFTTNPNDSDGVYWLEMNYVLSQE